MSTETKNAPDELITCPACGNEYQYQESPQCFESAKSAAKELAQLRADNLELKYNTANSRLISYQESERKQHAEILKLRADKAELLEACQSLLALCEGGTGNALQRIDAARAAISKATT